MRKISRRLYNGIINDSRELKAIAFLLYVKHYTPCSVVSNYSYYKLSKLTGLHKETVRRRLETLGELNLISIEGKHNNNLRFNKVRAKFNSQNVNISALCFKSVKDVELGLQALFIVEIQKRKNYMKQLFEAESNPRNLSKYKSSKKKLTERGLSKFKDNGISYRTLSSRLNINSNKISEIICYGQKKKYFKRHRHFQKFDIKESFGRANFGFKGLVMLGDHAYLISASTFTLRRHELPLITQR